MKGRLGRKDMVGEQGNGCGARERLGCKGKAVLFFRKGKAGEKGKSWGARERLGRKGMAWSIY